MCSLKSSYLGVSISFCCFKHLVATMCAYMSRDNSEDMTRTKHQKRETQNYKFNFSNGIASSEWVLRELRPFESLFSRSGWWWWGTHYLGSARSQMSHGIAFAPSVRLSGDDYLVICRLAADPISRSQLSFADLDKGWSNPRKFPICEYLCSYFPFLTILLKECGSRR